MSFRADLMQFLTLYCKLYAMAMTLEELNAANKIDPKYKIFKEATQVVPGHGNSHSEIMFIGEAPGANEDKYGIPFVGAAGKFLDLMLESIGMKREDIYITNMVKCRPPANRDPLPEEIEIFKSWLDEEIRLINPKVFVPLGRHALHKFLPDIAVSQAHGQIFKYDDKTVFAMYHPAAALYNGGMRKTLLADFQTLRKFLDGEIKATEHAGVERAVESVGAQTVAAEVKKIMEDSKKAKEQAAMNDPKKDQITLF